MSCNEIEAAIGVAFVQVELAKAQLMKVASVALCPGMVRREQWQEWCMALTMAESDLIVATHTVQRLRDKFAEAVRNYDKGPHS